MTEPTFSWLQFGDMEHIPEFEPFFESVLKMIDQGLRPDAVIFTGDFLIASSDEVRLQALSDFWNTFAKRLNPLLPFEPVYLAVPGDRDVPSETEAENFKLRFWTNVRDRFWQGDAELRASLAGAFAAYEQWLSRSPFRRAANPSRIPGDQAVTVPVRGTSDHVGLLLLNTCYAGRTPNRPPLADPMQIDGLSGLNEWSRSSRWRALITHQEPIYIEGFQEQLARLRVNSRINGLAGPTTLGKRAPRWEAPPNGYLGCKVEFATNTIFGYVGEVELGEFEVWAVSPQRPFFVVFPQPPHKAEIESGGRFQFRLKSLELTEFRCFASYSWVLNGATEFCCLAGINGAGKSSILQAIALLALGPNRGRELGGARLSAMRRGNTGTAVIRGTFVDENSRETTVALSIDEGSDSLLVVEGDPEFWSMLRGFLILSYGATRNLSTSLDSRYDHLSPEVRQQMTLFDPLTQLASAEVLLKEHTDSETTLLLFSRAIQQIFGDDLQIRRHNGSIRFEVGGKDIVGAVDLPDGFRASAAWIADLCAAWCRKNPGVESPVPSDVSAMVLIDEIDLHLHPSLQRELVPRLRRTFPNVQFIVTTHSPLVLANFNRDEIIALDRNVPGNVRFLDREIKAFTMDEIYEWLMNTRPTGAAIEEELAKAEASGSTDELAAILRTSPQVNEDEAHRRVTAAQDILAKLNAE